ncbi:FAD-dependent oxidoreductase [Xanthocytophaga agilis]|uniref:FAD-dependent oxidoreductase n=1 Tax=Xanthocytophaga agilis TaxID=3048010 RepID=A0AAE3R381_9BACT|nr:FAD-dependent oxidoreductase [Xanthocytophaga agilis]MDJ1500824.1 FAD-dependent oxidoreductase [Xanthocytophaga agilis]
MRKLVLLFLLLPVFSHSLWAQQATTSVDICVYGGSSAGVMAAYTAKKAGKSVILIEPGKHLGGLTTGGLGYTDIGNKYAITGLARDYYRRIGKHYGKFEQWIFEPHVAENLFKEYISKGNVQVLYSYRLSSVKKQGTTIQEIVIENSDKPSSTTNRIVKAKMFLDCTYEGDLMAKAGVSYFVGREDNKLYNETYNGVQLLNKHQFVDGIDPYKIPGKPESGLLWGISSAALPPTGSGDKKVQTYNFRICLTSDPANQIPITKPEGYDPEKYELLLRVMEKEPTRPFNLIMKPDLMPNYKTDINNNGPFSTDMIGMNYDYPEADYARRAQIQKEHELYTKGFLYFVGNDPRVPEHLRTEMKRWGYPKDEYTDNGNWSPQMYVREARRMIGAYVMTQANCQGKETVQDGVGMAAYTMDSHNCQRIVIEKDGVKMVKNEGDVQIGGFPPYPIAYRSLIPKESECGNLLVPVCLSASHIAYGSIRMEPVFMVLAQSSALAASLAIDSKRTVQNIDVQKLQQWLKANPLMDNSPADILVDDQDKVHIVLTGDWKSEHNPGGSYGPSWLADDSQGKEKKAVRFVPEVVTAGKYAVYMYFPKVKNAASETAITITNGKDVKALTIKEADIRVEGQTAGEWVLLGEYSFPKGKSSYVEISNTNANGSIIADAVLFVPKQG